MNFPLVQLHTMGRSKPIVKVGGVEEELQWDYCDLEGLPTERIGVTVTDMGKLPKGQWDNLPKTFKDTNGGEYLIEHIIVMKEK